LQRRAWTYYLTNLQLLILAFSSMLATGWSLCKRCNTHNIACYNETHFHICIEEKPFLEGGILPCGEGKICTDTGVTCADASLGFPPGCPSSEKNCRACDDSELFQCTSRNTFRMCSGNEFTGKTHTCPEDTVCSISSGKFCVKDCELTDGKYECDKDAP